MAKGNITVDLTAEIDQALKAQVRQRDEEIARLRGHLRKIRDLGCRIWYDHRDLDMTAIAIAALGHGADPAQKEE